MREQGRAVVGHGGEVLYENSAAGAAESVDSSTFACHASMVLRHKRSVDEGSPQCRVRAGKATTLAWRVRMY